MCCGALNERVLDARELEERESSGRALFCCAWVELFCERAAKERFALFCDRAEELLRSLLRGCAAYVECRAVLLGRAKFELRFVLAATAPRLENSPGRAVAATAGRP